jgi:hypothetical protein
MADLQTWLTLLRSKFVGKMPEDDCANAEGIFKKITEQANDADYGVGAVEHSGIRVDLTTSDTADTFVLSVHGRRNVSMKKLVPIIRSYPDIFDISVVAVVAHRGDTTFDIDVTVYKTASKAQRGLMQFEAAAPKDVKPQINGMDLVEADRLEARRIAKRVINMDIYGKPLLWQFANCEPSSVFGDTYLIMAYPIKSISLSFFCHLVEHHPSVRNIVFCAMPFKNEPGTSQRIEIHVHCLSDEPLFQSVAGGSVNKKRGHDDRLGIQGGGIHKKPRRPDTTQSKGWLSKLFG